MASQLTEVAKVSRKIIKWAIGAFIGSIILTIIIVPLTKAVYRRINPPKPYSATVGFGKLDPLYFPSSVEENYQVDFQLVSSKIPEIPDRVKVFFVSTQFESFFAQESAQEVAALLGFSGDPITNSNYVYKWTKSDPAKTELEIDKKNNTNHYTYQWQTDNDLLVNKDLPNQRIAATQALNFLDNFDPDFSDIDTSAPIVDFYKNSGNKMVKSQSFDEATFLKINFPREDIVFSSSEIYRYSDKSYTPAEKEYIYKIVGNHPCQSNIYAIVASGNKIIESQYIHNNIDYFETETYPLKPLSVAQKELQEKKAFVANKKEDQSSDTVIIRRVYLAYYEPENYQKFLQPIYIFSENDIFSDDIRRKEEIGFVAYVPAIKNEHINYSTAD